jgi:uncharacterized protein
MNIDITKLKSGYQNHIDIDMTHSYSKEELKGTGILKLDDVKITGYLENSYDDYHLDILVSGTMILPCSVTLEEVPYPFSFRIDEIMEEFFENEPKKYKRCENSIDISEIIWENIVMEIPMKVVSPNAENYSIEGDGWRLLKDDEERKHSPFENLNDLLK